MGREQGNPINGVMNAQAAYALIFLPIEVGSQMRFLTACPSPVQRLTFTHTVADGIGMQQTRQQVPTIGVVGSEMVEVRKFRLAVVSVAF